MRAEPAKVIVLAKRRRAEVPTFAGVPIQVVNGAGTFFAITAWSGFDAKTMSVGSNPETADTT